MAGAAVQETKLAFAIVGSLQGGYVLKQLLEVSALLDDSRKHS
jgi:hypothetical protein